MLLKQEAGKDIHIKAVHTHILTRDSAVGIQLELLIWLESCSVPFLSLDEVYYQSLFPSLPRFKKATEWI